MASPEPRSPGVSPRSNSGWKASLPRGSMTPSVIPPSPPTTTTTQFSQAHASILFSDPMFSTSAQEKPTTENIDSEVNRSLSQSQSNKEPLPYKKPSYPLPKKKEKKNPDSPGSGSESPSVEDDDEDLAEVGAEDKAEGADLVWQLATEKGDRYYTLRLGRREETFEINDLREGWYVLRVATPDLCSVQKFPILPLEWRKIPGIQALRNLRIVTHVSSGRGQSPNPEDDVIFASRNVISTNNSLVELYFQVKPEDLLSKLKLSIKTQAKFPFVAKARLCRYEKMDATSPETFQQALMFRRLARRSSYKKRAFEAGMVRPFLLLVSMDSPTRHHVGRLLGITLANSRISDGDSHAESYKILFRGRIGLKSRTEVLFEKVKFDHVDWFNCVHRACVKLIKTKDRKDMKKEMPIKDTLEACRLPRDPALEEVEVFFLEKLMEKLYSNLPEEDKVLLEELYETDQSRIIAETLREQGFPSPELHKLVILLLELQALKLQRDENKALKKQKKRDKKKDGEDVDDEVEDIEEGEDEEEGQPKEGDDKDDDDDDNDKDNNSAGIVSPYSNREVNSQNAVSAVTLVALITAKFVLFAINPFLCFGVGSIFMFAEMNKSNHGLVFLVVTQLLTRRLILASKGVSLDSYHVMS